MANDGRSAEPAAPTLRVSFEQSGGFAGLLKGCVLDANELPADESAELTEVLAQLRSRFVQVAKLVAAQMQREMQGMPGPGGGGDIAGSIGMGGMSAGMSVGGTTSPGGLIMPD